MKIYTKNGDKGRTSLGNGDSVFKTDARIELLGTVDELSSHLGLVKTVSCPRFQEQLSRIQKTLIRLMAGIADARNPAYQMKEEEIDYLEKRIDKWENSFPRAKEFVLYGGCEQSARLDVARAVARRAERQYHRAAQIYGGDEAAARYLNRLSDYLYMAARYADYLAAEENKAGQSGNGGAAAKNAVNRKAEKVSAGITADRSQAELIHEVVKQVLEKLEGCTNDN